jgi:DAK2 domain fusion protein YloV
LANHDTRLASVPVESRDPVAAPGSRPDIWPGWNRWLGRAIEVIAASAPALNAMNVFPVSDSDTGTNVELTLAGIARAVPAVTPDTLGDVVRAAILSAHGNSGAIVAEMVVSVCRALEREQAELRTLPAGGAVAMLLDTAAAAANRAVARPVAGTILTVADASASAAKAAAAVRPDDPLAVARAARTGGREALARTPDQLEALANAGVVDAGGQAFVLLVDVLVEALGGEPANPLTLPDTRPASAARAAAAPLEYEVMYALTGAAEEALDRLRGALSEVGNSVVVVGDASAAQVHVHLVDAGAALEPALELGRLTRIRITGLGYPQSVTGRTVIALVAGQGLARAVEAMGAVPVLTAPSDDLAGHLSAALGHAGREVVLLPNGMLTLERANQLADGFRDARRIAVIPSQAQIQGLAAVAVHEPASDFDSAVAAMSRAAGHARHGGVTVAETAAMTMAGPCRPGDVLGVLDGDIVEIGDSLTEVGWRVIARLLAGGGELLTLVTGEGAQPELVEELSRRAQHAAEALDIDVVDGGQRRYVLLVGME